MWIFPSLIGLSVFIALSSQTQQPPAVPAPNPVPAPSVFVPQAPVLSPVVSQAAFTPEQQTTEIKTNQRKWNRKLLKRKPIGEDVINAMQITKEKKAELKRKRNHFDLQFQNKKQKVEEPSDKTLVVKNVLLNLMLLFSHVNAGPVKLESSRFGQQTFNNPGTAMKEYESAKMLAPGNNIHFMPRTAMIEYDGIFTHIGENEFQCHPSPNEQGVTKCELLHEQKSVKEGSKLKVYVDLNNDGRTMEEVAEVKVGEKNNGACEMTEQGEKVGENCKPAKVVIKEADIKNLKHVPIPHVPVPGDRVRRLQAANLGKLSFNPHSFKLERAEDRVPGLVIKNTTHKQRHLLELGATVVTLFNNQKYSIWPGIQSDPLINGGGLDELKAGESVDLAIPATWKAARIWARTGCEAGTDTCTSGKCGGAGVQCQGTGGEPPVSLAEFTKGADATPTQTFYDVSYVDGWNLPIAIEPLNNVEGTCNAVPGCNLLNTNLPGDMFKKDTNGYPYLVESMCQLYTGKAEQDIACCAGAHGTPQTCQASWNSDMNNIYTTVKAACPGAYAFAYDDTDATRICDGNTNFKVTFGMGMA